MNVASPECWLFQRAALGDSVLLWPLLRTLAARFRVVLVTDRSKGLLAARELGIGAVDAEQPRLSAMWRGGATLEPIPGVARVVSLLESAEEPTVWSTNARAVFAGAVLERITAPLDRKLAIELAARAGADPAWASIGGAVRTEGGVTLVGGGSPVGGGHARIVLHVGAGARAKWWPLARWERLMRALSDSRGCLVRAIAGEVEAERFSDVERSMFSAMGGAFLFDLLELADTIKSASLVVAADTGAAHLAGGLGVPTLALFGPTDPDRWAPIGPAVEIVRAPGGVMADLDDAAVFAAAVRLLERDVSSR